MHDVGIILDHHLICNFYRTNLRHTAYIVAPKIEQHQMLGQFLWIGQQVLRIGLIFSSVGTAGPGTGNGPDSHLIIA